MEASRMMRLKISLWTILFINLYSFQNVLATDFSSCPKNWQLFKSYKINPSKHFILVPGAGSEGKDLYLGHLRWGEYFQELIQELKKNDPEISIAVFPSDFSGNQNLERRVIRLRQFIKSESRRIKGPVHVLGHSLGGIVTRMVTTEKDLAPFVASALYLSTPHRGTPIVDFLLGDGRLPKEIRFLSYLIGFDLKTKEYLSELETAVGDSLVIPREEENSLPPQLTIVSMQTAKELAFYFPPFALSHEIMQRTEGQKIESDGMVPVSSQLWGECLFVSPTNHGSVIGKIIHPYEKEIFEKHVKMLYDGLVQRTLL
jgi:triacylglycerol lipase